MPCFKNLAPHSICTTATQQKIYQISTLFLLFQRHLTMLLLPTSIHLSLRHLETYREQSRAQSHHHSAGICLVPRRFWVGQHWKSFSVVFLHRTWYSSYGSSDCNHPTMTMQHARKQEVKDASSLSHHEITTS
jgi:hypothetical protein